MNEIIVGVDDSDTAKKAAREAAKLAERCNSGLHLVTAVTSRKAGEVRAGGETWHIDATSLAQQLLDSLRGELSTAAPITSATVDQKPADALVSEAERLDALMIVVGNRRVQGAGRVLGSVASDVARKAPCNVLIAHTT